MTGLVAPPPAPDPAEAAVAADGWYPPVPLASLRERIRMGEGVVTTPRLTSAVEGAILSARAMLTLWRAAREAEGAQDLAATTETTINGRNMAALLWERAVHMFAAAELANLNRDVSATNTGLDRAAEKQMTADDYRRLAYAAVTDLQSIGEATPVPRNRVSLL